MNEVGDTQIGVVKRIHAHIKHHWLTISFVLGFVCDNIMLHRIDQMRTNLILSTYMVVTMLSIVTLYVGVTGKFHERVNGFLRDYSPVVMQFVFGGVLSGMLIFYSRSGSLLDNWLFILIIIVVIVGNETIRDRSKGLVYNFSIVFVGLFMYLTLIAPVLVGKMGAIMFVVSGTLALVIMYGFVHAVSFIVPNYVLLQKRTLVFIIGLLYVGFNVLYFTNLIPPVPLSLEHIGIYHSVQKYDDHTYELVYERPRWWQFLRETNSTFHYTAGENMYCYAAIFAPSRLTTKVYHHWQYYDREAKEWKEYGRFAYQISGGREEGYRGYTYIRSTHEGTWRCSVETERGQVIGRESFQVLKGEPASLLTERE